MVKQVSHEILGSRVHCKLPLRFPRVGFEVSVEGKEK